MKKEIGKAIKVVEKGNQFKVIKVRHLPTIHIGCPFYSLLLKL